jgi:hypothetical protein
MEGESLYFTGLASPFRRHTPELGAFEAEREVPKPSR